MDKAVGYGYKKIGFILDRGYFSKKNIEHMDMCGYSFVIMVKGMASFVNQLFLEHRGSFEDKRIYDMDGYGLYGKTVKRKLYETDEKDRYFHIYHSVTKEAAERTAFEEKLRKMRTYLLEPAAIRELEKIEMVRQTDNVYRLDHAVTATQKTILGAFGLNESHIKNRALEISNILKKNKK